MKKSVNGKSFDEIFEQRGRKRSDANVKNMIIGKTYFLDQSGKYPWNWIFIFTGFKPQRLLGTLCISSNDYSYTEFDVEKDEYNTIREATKDQIDLLNLYKSEQ